MALARKNGYRTSTVEGRLLARAGVVLCGLIGNRERGKGEGDSGDYDDEAENWHGGLAGLRIACQDSGLRN